MNLRLPVVTDGDGGDPLVDGLARKIAYLRISLTDRCNYRCTYCMPPEGVDLVPRAEVLSFEEVAEIVAALKQVGVRRVRLTGGEPTVRKDLLLLVARLAALGLEDLSLSTNGERLPELALPLRQAGLMRLNVSLDSLDPTRFRHLTRRGHLGEVLAGLEAARAAGFRHTKINTVAMQGFNDDEVGPLCRYAFDRDFTPRFIELMPMAEGALFYPGSFLPAARIRAILEAEFGRPPLPEEAGATARAHKSDDERPPGVGPARHVWVPYQGRLRRVGIISAVTEPFCDTCNRVRLSATGQLHACLGGDEAMDLRGAVRGGGDGAARAARILDVARQAVRDKRAGHAFTQMGCGGPRKFMVSIGG